MNKLIFAFITLVPITQVSCEILDGTDIIDNL